MGEEPEFLYLTTTGRRTGRAREIEIWFTHHEGRYYLVAEHASAQWVQNLRANPAVRVRADKEHFGGRARMIDPASEPGLSAAAQARSEAKYGWGDGLVVEITPDG